MDYVNKMPEDGLFSGVDHRQRLRKIKQDKLDTSDFISMALVDHPRNAVEVFFDRFTDSQVDFIVTNYYALTPFIITRLTDQHLKQLWQTKPFFVHKYLDEHPYYEILMSKRDDSD